jgi:hypothetical protein
MKETFILDENVLISALKCSQSSNGLISEIVDRCHSIAVDYDLSDRYWSILKRRKGSVHEPFLRPVISQLLLHAGKCRFDPNPRGESAVPIRHRKDTFLAEIATRLQPKPVIVTNDRRTRANLNDLGYDAISAPQALARVRSKASSP